MLTVAAAREQMADRRVDTAAVEGGTTIRVASELSKDRVRYERHAKNFLGMRHLACFFIPRGVHEMTSSLVSEKVRNNALFRTSIELLF